MSGLALDIDDTIADTSFAFTERMLQQYGHTSMNAQEIVSTYGYPSLVTEWQLPKYQTSLQKMYENLEFYTQIPPLQNAVEKVRELSELAPVQCYITSRTTPMYAVTLAWLAENNFPSAPLICRPPEVNEADWKIRYLVSHGFELLGLVDNELYVPSDVEFDLGLFELVQFRKISPPHPELIQCGSWDEVINEVRDWKIRKFD